MMISMISVKRYTEGTLDRVYFDQEFYDLVLQAAQRMLGGVYRHSLFPHCQDRSSRF